MRASFANRLPLYIALAALACLVSAAWLDWSARGGYEPLDWYARGLWKQVEVWWARR